VKITKIETLRPLMHPSSLWIQLHDEKGNVGLGETFFSQSVIEEYVHAIAAPLLLSLPSASPESVSLALTPYIGFQGGGIEMRALGGIDIALWDLWGKRLGAPVVELLGGQVRDNIKIYNTCAGTSYMKKTSSQNIKNWGIGEGETQEYEDLNAFMTNPAKLARELFDSGIKGMKIWPFDLAAERTLGASISKEELDFGVGVVAAIRKEVGLEMDIMIELHGLWQRPVAETIMNALASYDIYWFEDPIRPDAIDAISFLRASTGQKIATGETAVGRRGILPLLQKNAVDFVTIDVQWTGGLTEARKIASLAQTFAIPIAPHDCTGPVSLAACTHLVLSQSNSILQETARAFINTWYQDFVTGIPIIKNGYISITKDSGHGVMLKDWVYKDSDIIIRTSKP
jgi:L-alanine-DL-glutamate epimerase-like enolase superfamily enzyme